MKEQVGQASYDIHVSERREFERKWKISKWSKLRSLVDVGINPDNTILSLWRYHGNTGEIYNKYLEKSGFTYNERQRFWGIMTLFQNRVGDEAKIEEWVGLQISDLKGIRAFDKTARRILVRAFARSTPV
jgi:hypothetical protein